jgi:hypothetical protein
MNRPESGDAGVKAKGSFWRSVKVVAWAFVGIRKGSERQQDFAQLSPIHVVVVGILSALLFVLALVGLVNWVLAG